MFCSVKIDKKDNYRFYLCERTRVNGKVKSSDIYILTLQKFDIVGFLVSTIAKVIVRKAKNKGFEKDSKEVNLILDKYLDIREELLKEQRAEEEAEYAKQQEQARERARFYEEFTSKYSSVTTLSHYTEKEKEFLKIIYKAGAMKLHPDRTNDNGEAMQFLNRLKEEWGI